MAVGRATPDRMRGMVMANRPIGEGRVLAADAVRLSTHSHPAFEAVTSKACPLPEGEGMEERLAGSGRGDDAPERRAAAAYFLKFMLLSCSSKSALFFSISAGAGSARLMLRSNSTL